MCASTRLVIGTDPATHACSKYFIFSRCHCRTEITNSNYKGNNQKNQLGHHSQCRQWKDRDSTTRR